MCSTTMGSSNPNCPTAVRATKLDPGLSSQKARAGVIVVSGMTCQHCVHAVTEEVSAVPGVSDVSVDLNSGRLTVVSSAEVPFAAIATAVDEAGYAVAPA